jgi:putative chitinase
MVILTENALAAATGAPLPVARTYLPYIQGACKVYDITSPKRLAGFLSQIGHESAGLTVLTESLNYSVEGLLKGFGRHRISEADARRYGRAPGRPADQQAIANLLYGGVWGSKNLGNNQWGDGWRYRGRGLKQLTGRANYLACSNAIGEDFVNRPERILEPVNAALSAGWFWSTKGLNKLADKGDVVGMTKVINGGDKGLAERITLYRRALLVVG